jgi:hypothetical protein
MKQSKLDTLKGSADKVENYSHMVPFTFDELAEIRTNLVDEIIIEDKLNAEFKEVKEAHKALMKPVKQKIKNMRDKVRDKGEWITEECYIMFEGEFAVYYSGEGVEVYKRPLMASEKQQPTIQMEIRKEGTND